MVMGAPVEYIIRYSTIVFLGFLLVNYFGMYEESLVGFSLIVLEPGYYFGIWEVSLVLVSIGALGRIIIET